MGKSKFFIWNKKIYMDETVSENPMKFRRMIERKKIIKSCYCITLPANSRNCMDIYSSRELWFDYRRRQGLEVIGLAADKCGALEIVERITRDILERFGEINSDRVHEFFCSLQ